MWRRKSFHRNQDSDQSISDEEEIEFHCSERCVSLEDPSRRVESNLAMQFDLLSGGFEVKGRRKHIADEKNAVFSSEDEVEMPIFNKVGSDEEKNKDEKDHVASASAASWSLVKDQDVKQPPKFEGMSFTEGVKTADWRVRDQPNLLHVQPCHQQINWHFIPTEKYLDSHEPPRLEESLLAVANDSLEEAANPVEGLQAKFIHELEDVISSKAFGRHENAKYSMADLLDGLQEKNCASYAILKRVGRKGRKRKVDVNRNTSLVEKGTVNDEDPCEIIDSGSSSDDESKDRSVVPTKAEVKRKTIADQFHEALGATSVNEDALLLMPNQSRTCCSGLLEKLQRVIQREKEHDLDFMKNLRSETLADESGYIDVKLLSRSFEAKLTVCLCSISCYKKFLALQSSVLTEKFEEEMLMRTTRTVIFTSRTCGDVELDAGNYVRVYPPWKEVQVQGGKIIILASYFTKILI